MDDIGAVGRILGMQPRQLGEGERTGINEKSSCYKKNDSILEDVCDLGPQTSFQTLKVQKIKHWKPIHT